MLVGVTFGWLLLEFVETGVVTLSPTAVGGSDGGNVGNVGALGGVSSSSSSSSDLSVLSSSEISNSLSEPTSSGFPLSIPPSMPAKQKNQLFGSTDSQNHKHIQEMN